MLKKRKHFPQDFEITDWESLEKEYQKLINYQLDSKSKLVEFWEIVSELEKIIEDKVAWLYIDMTRFADNPEHRDAFGKFMSTIGLNSEKYFFKLKKKFYDCPFRAELPKEYEHLNKIIASEMEIFREENIELSVKEQKLISRYGEITSKMTVPFDGEEKTIQQLAMYFEDQDRSVRERAWKLTYNRYGQDKKELDDLFDELKAIRVQMAKNSGFDNYRDYAHKEKRRFSYTPEDLLKLHQTVEKIIVPLVEEFNDERREKLSIDTLRPWDFNVNINGETTKPFLNHQELIEKGIKVLSSVDSIFGDELKRMQAGGFLDIENRKGKAPGGYCYPLYDYNSSFIFMHAVGVRRDVETFMHESGHAMHNMLSKNNSIFQYTNNPSEIAELASMSMELISFDHWNYFYAPESLASIRKDEIMNKVKFIPWGVTVDAFQHWLYTNPEHSVAQREEYFSELLDKFKIGGSWTGLEKEKAMRWMLQLHFFQFPFYYIEYVIAQLGAIGIYRNYRKDSQQAVKQYKEFLKLGYSKSVDEVYESAGIPFDFSEKYIEDLMDFVREELK
ncbi:MAG: M3 family oligoendopeptidase [Candidatus Moranbacteria bacterium]|nr:M3 family oligoendopeptidase [Candidatus Moranbacteria bacterium]